MEGLSEDGCCLQSWADLSGGEKDGGRVGHIIKQACTQGIYCIDVQSDGRCMKSLLTR